MDGVKNGLTDFWAGLLLLMFGAFMVLRGRRGGSMVLVAGAQYEEEKGSIDFNVGSAKSIVSPCI